MFGGIHKMAQAISQDDYLNDTSQFDLARKKAQQQATVDLQSRKDALTRRFASLGNLDSGARIKQEENASNDVNSTLQNANEGINAQQQAELGRRKEVVQGQQFQSGEADKQRAYGTSERVAGQDFAGQQAAMQRKFTTGERLSSQDFGSLEAKLGRQFTTQEREALQTYQTGEANKQRALQSDQFKKTFDLSSKQFNAANDQFNRTFAEEVRINDANIGFAQQALDKKGFLEGIGNSISGGFKGFGASISNGAKSIEDGVSSWF